MTANTFPIYSVATLWIGLRLTFIGYIRGTSVYENKDEREKRARFAKKNVDESFSVSGCSEKYLSKIKEILAMREL